MNELSRPSLAAAAASRPPGLGEGLGLDSTSFRPRRPWLGGDLQTLRNMVLLSLGRLDLSLPGPPPERVSFIMEDGDLLLGLYHAPPVAAGRPLVTLVHGLTGCETSSYVVATARHLLGLGYPVLRLNLRGAGPSRPVCRGHYHAGRSEDLRAVLAQRHRVPGSGPMIAVGYSLGGNMLLKLLAEDGAASPLLAAAVISAPIDLEASQRRLMRPRNRFYHDWLLARMKRSWMGPSTEVTAEERRRAAAARTVYAFDDTLVAPRNGFGDAAAYYARCSAAPLLPAIRVPTLVVHALDDPWIPAAAYERVAWRDNPFLVPLLPRQGGHVGFHDAAGPPAWHDRCLGRFLDGVLDQRTSSLAASTAP